MRKYWNSHAVGVGVVWLCIFVLMTGVACRRDFMPKPDAFFRIGLPDSKYDTLSLSGVPVSFEYAAVADIVTDSLLPSESWFNIEYPRYNAIIYCTYIKSDSADLLPILDESRKLVYRQSAKSDAIDAVYYDKNNVYATLYSLYGGSATPLQFVATDSVCRVLRGALYFSQQVNPDSIAPVIEFMSEDMMHLIETIKWK